MPILIFVLIYFILPRMHHKDLVISLVIELKSKQRNIIYICRVPNNRIILR